LHGWQTSTSSWHLLTFENSASKAFADSFWRRLPSKTDQKQTLFFFPLYFLGDGVARSAIGLALLLYDKMSNNKMSKSKMLNDKMSNDKLSNDKMSNDKMSNDKMSNDKMLSDKMSNDKMSNDKKNVE
jgi:pentapeptide MXKDX repeat protein